MSQFPFTYSARPQRPPLQLPGGARIGVYVAPNVEYFPPGRPAISLFAGTAGCPPDPLNAGWRDYGMRVGLWRVAEVLQARGITPSVAVNAAVCEHYPQVIDEGVARGWTWICHGRDNATFHVGMDEAAERAELGELFSIIENATGSRPRGWLGPALTETWNTPRLLSEIGATYVLDWCNDDEPYVLDVADGQMISVPYLAEVSDIPIFHLAGGSTVNFVEAVCRHFDRLYLEGAERPSIMGLGVHPFLIGQPGRIGALEQALDHILGHENIWITTADDIADWFRTTLNERDA